MSEGQVVTFWLADRWLGLPVEAVREVNRHLRMTPVQRTAPWVRGLLNLRGQIVTIFDLRVRLGLPPGVIGEATHNVILKAETVGLMVDRVGDVIEVGEGHLKPAPANLPGNERAFLDGVLERSDGLLGVLSPERVLDPTITADETPSSG